tara:strand:+ start:103 stop:369 length:267 start_codon:yes stop_codon:yes gene_type:complete
MATLPNEADLYAPQMKKVFQLYIDKFGERSFADLEKSITIRRLGNERLDKDTFIRYEYLVTQAIKNNKRLQDGDIDSYVFQHTEEELT